MWMNARCCPVSRARPWASEMSDRQPGRGQLSSIDMLPEEADDDIVWALEQLREARLPQNTILIEFNERLADKAIDPISKSAWNRYSVRKAKEFRKLDEARRMARELNKLFDASSSDEVTILIAELIKVGLQDVLMNQSELKPKAYMEAARALQSVVQSQKSSADHRAKLQEEERQKNAELVNSIGKKAGLSSEALAEINNRLMGGA